MITARIPEPVQTDLPAVTSDIYPTLLEIAGIEIEDNPDLDGISLVPMIDRKLEERPRPIGFWEFPEEGRLVWSDRWMRELWRVQQAGEEVDSSRLHLDAGEISGKYPADDFRGHAAWLEWPYKLHRIEDSTGNIRTELYHLETDPGEQNDLSESETARLEAMQSQLENWQRSVMESYNGNDYR